MLDNDIDQFVQKLLNEQSACVNNVQSAVKDDKQKLLKRINDINNIIKQLYKLIK
jgi:gas vesicle protein